MDQGREEGMEGGRKEWRNRMMEGGSKRGSEVRREWPTCISLHYFQYPLLLYASKNDIIIP